MNLRTVEITVGLFVVAAVASLFMLAMKVSNLASYGGGEGYLVTARFDNVGGLKVRAPVSIGGVRIGRVHAISYDDERYEAVVTLEIDSAHQKLPADTTASILTSGLLGEQFIGLEAGADEEYLQAGDAIRITQSAIVFERLIGQFLFNKAAE